jgi:lysophospholipase L1-like esterase
MKKILICIVMLSGIAILSGQATLTGQAQSIHSTFKFDFGTGKVATGYQQILPTTIYDKQYGFEPGTPIVGVDRKTKDDLRGDFITSDKPFFFSVALPEGNYNVTITFGDAENATSTTVKAELRRLMLENIQTAPGKFLMRTFTVNIRRPQIAGGGDVKLKDREKTSEIWAWDEKLTLEFNGSRPAVCALEITQAENIPTIFLLGDSTVCDQPHEPYNSWGQMLTRFFKPGIVIANHAESGESLRSSLNARRLDKVLSLMKPGDYLFIQYGHNDQKEKGEGVGAFTTYKADLKYFVAEARKRSGIPVLITSVNRRNFAADGKVYSTLGDYPEAVRQLAKAEGVPLIDLNAMSKRLYEALGPDKSAVLFKAGDGTHHSNYGSYELAKCIVEGIRANKLSVAKKLATDVPRFDPSRPDPFEKFNVPPSPGLAGDKPLGN